MKKGVIYVRVSDPNQVSGTSLENQERACRDYAVKSGIEILQTFVEKGESATAANRTEFLKALAFCRERRNEVEAFIVWKIDRFARNTTDHFAVRAKLTQYGVTLQSVTEPITQDHIGKLMETFLAGYAEFENEVRKQRCTGGMQGKLRNGIWCWWPPIGYIHSKRLKDRRKTSPDEPDPERFSLIQRGLRLYKAGAHSITSLAAESNKWGLKTRTGKPMTKQLWDKILVDKFYVGILVDPWTRKEYLGLHKPMIMLDEYRRIQAVKKGLSNNATGPRDPDNPDFPLRHFVLCECGRPYTASWSKGRSKKYPFYHCHNRECLNFGLSISREGLETGFCKYLDEMSLSPDAFANFRQKAIAHYRGRHEKEACDSKQFERELAKLTKRKKELLEMRMDCEISKEEYKDFKAIVDKQITRLNVPGTAETDSIDLESIMASSEGLIRDLSGAWKAMAQPYKQRLQRVVLPEGVMYQKQTRAFGTAILSPIFGLKRDFSNDLSDFVAGGGQNWNQIISDIQKLNDIAVAISDQKPKVSEESITLMA